MTDNQMWFGTREHMQYIPCPDSGADFSSVGYSSDVIQYLNGGAYIRNSDTSHRQFGMSWNMASREDLQPLYDYAAGVYGPAPYFFVDPMAADQNVLPEWWAAPRMALTDAPLLVGVNLPYQISTPSNSLGYPQGVLYTVGGSDVPTKLYLPIPPGMTLHIGVHGLSASTASIRMSPVTAGGVGTGSNLAMMGVASTTRFNTTQDSSGGVVGVELSVAGTGTLGLYGMVAQILPTGVAPEMGGFIGGQGHSGVTFVGKPTRMAYSSALNLVGAAVTMVETEGWAN